MENLKKLIQWMSNKPYWVKILVACSLVTLLVCASACGTPKTVATVQNVNPHSTVSVTMTVSSSNSTDVSTEASPNVPINP